GWFASLHPMLCAENTLVETDHLLSRSPNAGGPMSERPRETVVETRSEPIAEGRREVIVETHHELPSDKPEEGLTTASDPVADTERAPFRSPREIVLLVMLLLVLLL